MRYSVIVPVYNRPDEVDELLDSLTRQTVKDIEVIIVEDGSTKTCKDVCDKYADILDLHYYFKENSGPGQSRNYGAERAKGEYLLILDSDVVLPDTYIENLELRIDNYDMLQGMNNGMQGNHNSKFSTLNSQLAAFGGPDAAHPSFTPTQKAISYSMTSFFTTGGIRGGKKKLDKFYPRSFNMGIRRDVYMQLGGFTKMRFGEDIDFSYRICEAGYSPQLFPDAWVWHKRRTDFRKFFRQVYNSGIARINLEKRHPGTMKLVHLLPAAFTIGSRLRAHNDGIWQTRRLPLVVLSGSGGVSTATSLLFINICRLVAEKPQYESRGAVRSCRFHTTYGLRHGVPCIVVETLRAWQGRVSRL